MHMCHPPPPLPWQVVRKLHRPPPPHPIGSMKASGMQLISAAQAKQLYDIYAAGGASAAGVTFVDFEAVMR